MKASRDYFFEKIGNIMESEDVYIVSADLAGKPFDLIREKYPKRYVPVGIAEQNMMSVACGMALCGRRVVAYTSNPFIAFHAFEQIRNGASLMNLPITIAGVGVGFGISEYGTTHFVTEDFAMMSLCPNMKIVTVSDNMVAEMAYEDFLHCSCPTYLRFDKQCGDELAGITAMEYKQGWRYVRKGGDSLILSAGYMSHVAKNSMNDDAVIDLFAYPFDEETLVCEMKKFKRVYVFEEQQSRGGLGSVLLEIFNKKQIGNIEIMLKGVEYNGKFPSVYASRDYWLEKYELKPELWEK